MKNAAWILCSVVLLAPACFGQDASWPAGSEPATVARRLSDLFLSTDPAQYKPEGYSSPQEHTAKGYGGRTMHYAVVSLWVNALECARLSGDTELERKLIAHFEPFYGERADKLPAFGHVDFTVVGSIPLEIAALTGEKRAKELGLRYADQQWAEPKAGDPPPPYNVMTLEERLDWWRKGYSDQTRLWIDDMYMINVLQGLAYRVTGERKYIDRAAREMCLYLDEIQIQDGPDVGLFHHAPDVPYVWGRGAGWMAAGMPIILEYLPQDSQYREKILQGYLKMMTALRSRQNENGMWNQLVGDPQSWEETSCTAMFGFGFAMGVKNGWLDAAEYLPRARKAYLAVLKRTDRLGNVQDVCCGTGKKNDYQYYLDRPRIQGDPHGQCALMWLCRVFLEMQRTRDYVVSDRLISPALPNCRLQGKIGAKADTFFYRRCWGPEGRGLVMPEAEFAFTHPDDDVCQSPVGMWKGEFWGKLAISGARVAAYRNDADYKAFLLGSAHRLMACQRPDGYLGTYVDSRFVCPAPLPEARATIGWDCDWNWNLWCRKYTMWGLLSVYEVTGDRTVLEAAAKAMRQQIAMLREMNLKLCDTGTTAMCGLPPCSILKPLVLLYRATGDELFKEYAAEIVSYWDRDGNPPPNFFRNAERDVPIFAWYEGASRKPTKMYELLSCLDGLLEYYRLTGEKRCLDCVEKIADNVWTNERNALDSIGYNDNFANGSRHLNGSTEPCDIVHWMRLNYDLYLLTGDVKYIDVIELAYYNAFQAAVFKDGGWGAREVRSHVRHIVNFGQSGMQRQHCCVNNLPRGYMDVAQASATKDEEGRLRVNLYSDFTSDFDDVSVSLAGDFPFNDRVMVKITAKRPMTVAFRLPSWDEKAVFTPLVAGLKPVAKGRWMELSVPAGTTPVRIDFKLDVRLVDSPAVDPMDNDEYRLRWHCYGKAPDFEGTWRTEPAARLYYGPLLLSKAQYWGESRQDILQADMNGAGWTVRSATPFTDNRTMKAMTVEFERGTERRTIRVCDFGSAGDFVASPYGSAFSIWF